MSFSIKNILAAIAPGEQKQAGAEYAISMGAAFNAHVTGCSYALHPEFHGSGLPWFPDELIASHLKKVTMEAQGSLTRFHEMAKASIVEFASEVVSVSLDSAITAFGEQARTYDVTVLTQTTRGLEHVGDFFIEAALFYSGRPVIVVPKGHSAPFSLKRVLVAWDGSQYAAEAVAQAMPLLTSADRLEVLVVGDKDRVDKTRAAKLIDNLERYGIDVEFISRDEDDDANSIAREAVAWNASLLVMGGYGHSRAREMFFGGVTRFMLNEAPIPLLMAH